MAAVRADDTPLTVEHRIRRFRGRDVERCIGCHTRGFFLDVESFPALAAGVRPVLDSEHLHRHYVAGHDRRAVAAARHLTRAVLGPEGVNDLRACVLVVLALFTRNGKRVEIGGHHLVAGQVRPCSLFTLRAVAVVVRHDLRLDLGFNIGKQLLHLLQINVRQLLLDHEPRDRVEVVADHLHAKTRTFHQRGTATHKNIRYSQVLERPFLLVIGIVIVPDQLGRVRRIIRCFGGRCDQHRAEHTGTPPCPPLRHLVDRLARVAFNHRHLIDRQDGKIHFQAGLGTVGVVEIHGFERNRLACADGLGDLLLE